MIATLRFLLCFFLFLSIMERFVFWDKQWNFCWQLRRLNKNQADIDKMFLKLRTSQAGRQQWHWSSGAKLEKFRKLNKMTGMMGKGPFWEQHQHHDRASKTERRKGDSWLVSKITLETSHDPPPQNIYSHLFSAEVTVSGIDLICSRTRNWKLYFPKRRNAPFNDERAVCVVSPQ